jgi:hypothetical protein
MKKEFSHTKFRKPHHHFFKWCLIILALVILLCATGFFVYKFKKPQPLARVLYWQIEKVHTWAAERRHHLQNKLVKVKQLVINNNQTKSDIHFEFYTMLPTMQIKPQDAPEIKPVSKAIIIPKMPQENKIFDAATLQNSLENEIHKEGAQNKTHN